MSNLKKCAICKEAVSHARGRHITKMKLVNLGIDLDTIDKLGKTTIVHKFCYWKLISRFRREKKIR